MADPNFTTTSVDSSQQVGVDTPVDLTAGLDVYQRQAYERGRADGAVATAPLPDPLVLTPTPIVDTDDLAAGDPQVLVVIGGGVPNSLDPMDAAYRKGFNETYGQPGALTLSGWDVNAGDYLANEPVLFGTGLDTVTEAWFYDKDNNLVPFSGFTATDAQNLVCHWASGEITPLIGFRITDGVIVIDLITGNTHWAVGYSVDAGQNPTAAVNPSFVISEGQIKLTDINGAGNFASDFVEANIIYNGGVATNSTIFPADPEWASADGGNSIVLTDPQITGNQEVGQIQLHQPQGFIVVNVPVHAGIALLPTISTGGSPLATRASFSGQNFDLLNHVELIGTFNNYSYFDPNGPDAGSNPPSANMLSNWSSNVIELDDSQLGGEVITAIHLYGPGDVPDYGIQDIGDFSIDSAPVVTASESNVPCGMTLHGTGFDYVDHIRYDDNITDLHYYDPNGPQAGSNPGTATILAWTDTLIDIVDTARGNFHVSGNGSGPIGGRVLMDSTPAFGKQWSAPGGQQWHFPDYFVQPAAAAPTVGSFSSPETDGITMSGGTLLNTVTRVRLYWSNDTQNTFIDPIYTEQDANHIRIGTGYGMGLSGQTVSKVELWTGAFPGSLAATYPGLNVPIA